MEVSDGGQRRFERKTQPIISANRFDGLSCYIEREGILVRRKMSSFPDVRLAMQLSNNFNAYCIPRIAELPKVVLSMNWILELRRNIVVPRGLGYERTSTILGQVYFSVKKLASDPTALTAHKRENMFVYFSSSFKAMSPGDIPHTRTHLILRDSSGSSGGGTPATSCAPVSSWRESMERRLCSSPPFSLKESISAWKNREERCGVRRLRPWLPWI